VPPTSTCQAPTKRTHHTDGRQQEHNGEQLLHTAYNQAPGREHNVDRPSVEAGNERKTYPTLSTAHAMHPPHNICLKRTWHPEWAALAPGNEMKARPIPTEGSCVRRRYHCGEAPARPAVAGACRDPQPSTAQAACPPARTVNATTVKRVGNGWVGEGRGVGRRGGRGIPVVGAERPRGGASGARRRRRVVGGTHNVAPNPSRTPATDPNSRGVGGRPAAEVACWRCWFFLAGSRCWSSTCHTLGSDACEQN